MTTIDATFAYDDDHADDYLSSLLDSFYGAQETIAGWTTECTSPRDTIRDLAWLGPQLARLDELRTTWMRYEEWSARHRGLRAE